MEGLATRRIFFRAVAQAGPHEWLNQSVFAASLPGMSAGSAVVTAHAFQRA